MSILIRYALRSDKEKIRQFIEKYWKSNHIYVENEAIFDYLHLDNNQLSFVIILKEEEILGIHAFIPFSQFDKSLPSSDIFLSIWKIQEGLNIPGLGLRTLNFIEKNSNYRLIQALGFIEEITLLYKKLGFQVGYLNHHVLFNPDLKSFSIAKNVLPRHIKKPLRGIKDTNRLFLGGKELLKTLPEKGITSLCQDFIPLKSKSFLLKKYSDHPSYEYSFGVCKNREDLLFIFVYRIVSVGESKVLRIVDFLGLEHDLVTVLNQLYSLMIDNKLEYIDIYQHGLEMEPLKKSCS